MQKIKEEVQSPFEIYSLSECAVTIEFGSSVHIDLLDKISSFNQRLKQNPFPGMISSVLAYTTLSVFFDPVKVYRSNVLKGIDCFERVSSYLYQLVNENEPTFEPNSRVITVPVCYDDNYSPDLTYVASLNNLRTEEVIDLHCSAEYKVFMIGFIPGFAYLAGMSEKLATPRKTTPRKAVPAGAVGIAGLQTGIYPLECPGGWQIIGQTPLTLFDANRECPSLLRAGDTIQFTPIGSSEFKKLKSA